MDGTGVSRRRVYQWTSPVRKAVGRIRPSDNGTGSDHDDLGTHEWLMDCAVYVDGHRLNEAVGFRNALSVAREYDGFVWLGIHDPTEDEFAAVAKAYNLDELLVEKAVTTRHRPRIERHGDVVLFILRTTKYVEHSELTENSEVVETGEVLIFLGKRFVITVRHGTPGELAPVRADLEQRPDRLGWGPWAIAYAVCDRLVDSYLDVAEELEDDLDALEDDVFARVTGDKIAHIYQLKREMNEFKRAVAPLQRPMAAIIAGFELNKEIRRYFRDVNDHLLRVVERVTSYDDLLNSILQARLAQVSVAQNNDMRKIAAWAAIAAVQTAIAGIYGMNFRFMPELGWQYGYPAVLLLMALLAFLLYRGFRRSGWL